MNTMPQDTPQSTEASPLDIPAEQQISIVIPAYNEEGGIGDVLEALKANMPANVVEVIVVDDGSKDRTAEIVRQAGVRLLHHPTNRGYGASLKTGIREAKGAYVLTMDSDGQHRIQDIHKLCAVAVTADPPECVIGQRTAILHSSLWRMPGKWLLRWQAQFLTQKKIPDLNSGLRLMRREVLLRYMRLCPQGFSFSTTITMAFLSRGYGVDFVPIEVEKRVGKSTVSVKTGFSTILLVLRLATLFNPLRIFLPASFICIIGGAAWGVPYAMRGQGVTVASMLGILTGVLLFALGLICDQVAQLRLERFE